MKLLSKIEVFFLGIFYDIECNYLNFIIEY